MCSPGITYADIVRWSHIHVSPLLATRELYWSAEVLVSGGEHPGRDEEGCYITTTLRLMVDEDEFSIFIAEEGTSLIERSRAIYSDCKGISDESSKTSLPPFASISVVPKSVGEIIVDRKMPAAVLPREPNTKVHSPILGINASVPIVQEEPIRDDGLELEKIEFHWQSRGGECRKVGGEKPRNVGVEMDNQRLELDNQLAKSGDRAKALGCSSEAQTHPDNRKKVSAGQSLLLGPLVKIGELRDSEAGPCDQSGTDPKNTPTQLNPYEQLQSTNGVNCYMKNMNITEEEANAVILSKVENAWKDVNEELLLLAQNSNLPKPVIMGVVNTAKSSYITVHKYGNEFNLPDHIMKGIISSLFIEPMSI
ncbi:hypothetical protein Ancab_022849 [Ancistrocladus abbreviatus]